jgi:hypothetical protein
MFLHSRRFSVWLLSFLAVLVIYFIYNKLNTTPMITTNNSRQPARTAVDVCDANAGVGMVGDVGIKTVRNARYTRLNPQKQVEREFGFEELLHADGNDWEIEKPYYTIYGKSFVGTISGEKAKVTVETSAGQVTPRDGLLTGNVTIRIRPRVKGEFSEATVYLDDVAFAGDKSLFSTDGLVELVSDDLQMTGTGMEVVYDSDEERLEHLKIAKLKSLRVKRWARGTAFSSASARKNKADEEQKQESKSEQQYRCVLDQNVIIETAQERLMAQAVSISNFTISGGSREQKTEMNVEHRTSNIERSTGEAAGEVAISCDGGVLIVPMDSVEGRMAENETENTEQRTQNAEWKTEIVRDGKAVFYGQQVDYDAATGEAVSTGPSKIIFDVNSKNLAPAEADRLAEGPAVVTIVSQKEARFQPALNKAAFEGNCRCTVTQELADVNQQYIVTAENLEAVLRQRSNGDDSTPSALLRTGVLTTGDSTSPVMDIERVAAKGGDVRLASTKKIGERLLTGVEMKCTRMDYNAVSRDFAATGPGLIKYDNSQTDEPQKGLGRFSLRRKCFAFLRNFDSLKFTGGSNHLVAFAKEGSMLVDFIPIVERGKEDKVAVTASRVEADILERPGGRLELGGLTAKGAITYEDKDVEIIGDEFMYDAAAQIITVRGTPAQPCRFNGAEIDSVEGNVKTGKWKTKIKGPGAIR